MKACLLTTQRLSLTFLMTATHSLSFRNFRLHHLQGLFLSSPLLPCPVTTTLSALWLSPQPVLLLLGDGPHCSRLHPSAYHNFHRFPSQCCASPGPQNSPFVLAKFPIYLQLTHSPNPLRAVKPPYIKYFACSSNFTFSKPRLQVLFDLIHS